MSSPHLSNRRLTPSVLAVGLAALILGVLGTSTPMASAEDNPGPSDGVSEPMELFAVKR